ncbi:MAG TPA: hypothetical protein VGG10_08360 [Rhizomicrobium sp.]|jgi:hypothetical protein
MLVAVRGYAMPVREDESTVRTGRWTRKALARPSHEALIFDCETTGDHAQSLRFGTYQCRKRGELVEHGLFYETENLAALSKRDLFVLRSYAQKHGVLLRTREDFVDKVFYKYALGYGATVVGFNLPFDLSRLATAIATSHARDMRNAFSLTLLKSKTVPNVLVRHLNARASFIRFAALGQMDGRAMRKRHIKTQSRRGYFLDLKTISSALLGKSHTLKSLADALGTTHRKMETDGHGGPLNAQYLDYAMNDTQVTWECFERLSGMYSRHGLKQTPAHRIYSEASLGKAYLNEMNITPWRKIQADVPPALIGQILGTYYGGRSEVRIRRQTTRVLYCDFRSMYPTVCTLMGLWRFVIAKGFDWNDCTEDAGRLLTDVRLANLQDKATWSALAVLVQIQPDDDILPVRAAYDGKTRTIGLNHLSAAFPMWFTLADCIAAKILTGKTPRVINALRFIPRGVQDDLKPIKVDGDDAFVIDPVQGDFYRDLIVKRGQVQGALKQSGDASERDRYAAQQMMLKLVANSTSYGIFAEQNVQTYDRARAIDLYGQEDQFRTASKSIEEPGSHFHPLIATLITGAARLMLASAEQVASDNGLGWAFCDTDSLALARPDGMADGEFLKRATTVTGWFDGLDPYGDGKPLFKIEDQNFSLRNGKLTSSHKPLFSIAISAKRYVLFNLEKSGRPIIRKALAHGLGHLMEPYDKADAPASIQEPPQGIAALEVKRWQHDLWHRIALAFLKGHPDRIDLSDIPQLDTPARSRYGANTASLRNWFHRFNKDKPLHRQVRCFNFMLAYQVSRVGVAKAIADGDVSGALLADGMPAVVAPYSDKSDVAIRNCFDRRTGLPVPPSILKTYREAIAEYAWHAESKFGNATETDAGVTERRHVEAIAIEYIGKEANRWEEQMYVGDAPEAQIEYGTSAAGLDQVIAAVRNTASRLTQVVIAEAAGISRQELAAIVGRTSRPRMATVRALFRALSLHDCRTH